MVWSDETHLDYSDNPNMGFSFKSAYLDAGGLEKVMIDKNVMEHEERRFGKYDGIYLKYHSPVQKTWFNQRIYLLCPDINRVMIIYILSDIPKEEAVKVAENLEITESDTFIESKYVDMWSTFATEDNITSSVELDNSIERNQLHLYSIGDAFNISGFGSDDNGNYCYNNEISFCVDSVQVTDDLQLLDPLFMPEEWNAAINRDGKLVSNTLSYIKTGNGIDTLDKVVKTETVKQKLVYLTATYTNMSNQTINHLTYLVSLVTMKQENGVYQIYTPEMQSGDGYDFILGDSIARTGDMAYIDVVDESTHGRNNIPVLNPGESIQVNLAWVVNETDLKYMYLSPHSDGACIEFSEDMAEKGMVDIRQ